MIEHHLVLFIAWIAAHADYILPPIQWVFAAGLIPTILRKEHKPAFSTCLITAPGLLIMSIVFGSIAYTYGTEIEAMSIWNTAASAFAVAVCWSILLVQRYRINRRTGESLIRIPFWVTRAAQLFARLG